MCRQLGTHSRYASEIAKNVYYRRRFPYSSTKDVLVKEEAPLDLTRFQDLVLKNCVY
jgi:hypothetical protein